jgi:hypothetical protein
MHVSCSIDILSPASTIFEFLKNPQKAMLWQTSVSHVEIQQVTGDVIGTTGRETVSDARGSLEMQATVTRLEPDRLIALHVESRVNSVDVEYLLDPAGHGVHITQRADVRWKFPLNILMLFVGGRIRNSIAHQMQDELANLKRLCEPRSQAL